MIIHYSKNKKDNPKTQLVLKTPNNNQFHFQTINNHVSQERD